MERTDATIEDVRWWLKTARALAGVWREATIDGDPTAGWTIEGFHSLDTPSRSWTQFAIALNEGLQPFQTRVEYTEDFAFGEITYGAPLVGLYSAACAQIYNFIVQQRVARRCENETCRTIFVHQLGGAQQGQYRSKGVLRFCSPSCAQTESQRQYRRRKAARKKEQVQQ